MKKIKMLLMIMLVLVGIPMTAQAANAKASIEDVTTEPSKTIYLSVTLSDCDKANTLGITMEYDSKVLKKVTEECVWEREGVLQDFSRTKNDGVWASKKAEDLNGKICTLAFRVKADAPIGDSEITCKVIVKKDSTEIGTYIAKGTVTVKGEDEEVTTPDEEQDTPKPSEKEDSDVPENNNSNETTGNNKNESFWDKVLDVFRPNRTEADKNTSDSNKNDSNKNESTLEKVEELEDEKINASEGSEDEVDEHVHTEECEHDNVEKEEEDSTAYDWIMGILLIVIAIGAVFGAGFLFLRNRK